MTKQETFDFVVKAIVAQGVPSISDEQCLYRGPNGTKCAAGHLIPDDSYNPIDEGCNFSCALARTAVRRLGHDLDLVSDLQRAHDRSADSTPFLEAFLERCECVAEQHGLTMPEVAL